MFRDSYVINKYKYVFSMIVIFGGTLLILPFLLNFLKVEAITTCFPGGAHIMMINLMISVSYIINDIVLLLLRHKFPPGGISIIYM